MNSNEDDGVLPTLIITGASQGIGRCTAIHLSRYETPRYKLALLARNLSKLGETKELCCAENKSMRRNIEIFKCDITKTEQLKETVNYIGENFGPLATVINNAGVLFKVRMLALNTPNKVNDNLESMDRALNINLRGLIHCTTYALPYILETRKKYGARFNTSIINLGSRASTPRVYWPSLAIYSASKFGLVGFGHSLFHDIRQSGIKVCSLMPGFTDTNMINVEQHGKDFSSKESRALMIRPLDVALCIEYIIGCGNTVCPHEILLEPQYNANKKGQKKSKL
eukprot:479249_1